MKDNEAIKDGVVSEDSLRYLCPALTIYGGGVEQFVELVNGVSDALSILADGCPPRR